MEFLIGAISLISLGLNYLIYKRITATYPVGSVEETELIPAFYCCCKTEPELEPDLPSAEAVETTVQADYGAWKNQSNIPWSVQTAPPPPIKPVQKGPLARPDGFV